MKTLRRIATLGLVAGLGMAPFHGAAEEPAPKTHVLFLGTNLSVQRDQKSYRVEDISGSDLKIHVDQQEVFVPTRKGPVALQVNAVLKLSRVSVTVDQLESGPAYTYAHDPMRQLEQMSASAMDIAAAQDMANAQVARDTDFLARAQRAVDSHQSREPEKADAEVRQGQVALDSSTTHAASVGMSNLGEQANVGGGAHKMKLAEGNYDAMEVSFKVSSPVELDHPYMVVLFMFHNPTTPPGTVGLVIHAEALEPIGAKPMYVRVLKGGLPIGFTFLECSVHLYNRGVEVATNLSAKRVEMTHDETEQYIVKEHLGAHKGATLAAAAVRGSLPRTLRRGFSPEQLNRKMYVKVAQDGKPAGAYEDETCAVPLDDAATVAALGEAFFTPALEKGKPAEGIVPVRLADM